MEIGIFYIVSRVFEVVYGFGRMQLIYYFGVHPLKDQRNSTKIDFNRFMGKTIKCHFGIADSKSDFSWIFRVLDLPLCM